MGESIKKWYDERADQWRLNYQRRDKHFMQRIRNLHEMVRPLLPGQIFLDAGCGTGDAAVSLSRRFGVQGSGIDISGRMIEQCRAREGGELVAFKTADVMKEDFEGRTFDLVVSLSLIEWIDDVEAAIRHFSGILKENGQWIVSLPNWRSILRSMELLSSHFRKSSYLHLQRNRVSVEGFLEASVAHGFACEKKLYHVIPFYNANLPGFLGESLGMMCMLSLIKVRTL